MSDDNQADASGARYSAGYLSIRLDGIVSGQRDLKAELDRIQKAVAEAAAGGAERGFAIRRTEERLNDLYTRFLIVEANYVKMSEHEKSLAPFRKWGSWIAMLVIGGVVTAIMAMVLGKGSPS